MLMSSNQKKDQLYPELPPLTFEGVGDVLAITPTPWCPPQPDSPVTSSKILWRTFGQRGCETESARKVNDPEIFWHTIGQPGCEREYAVSGNLFWQTWS